MVRSRLPSMAARALVGLLVLGILVFALTTLPGVRYRPGFIPWIDGWLQGGLYVVAALLALLRPVAAAIDRRLWTFIGLALAARAVGFVVMLAVVRHLDPQPYPSWADVGWLAMYPLVIAALLGLARSDFRQLSTSLVLDGMIGALAIGAVAYAALSGTLAELTRPDDTAVVLVNLAYPVLDVMVLVVLLGVLLAYRGTASPGLLVLGLGIVGIAVQEEIFLYQVAAGTFAPGTYVQVLSAVSTGVIAIAGWLPGRDARTVGSDVLPHLLLPVLFAMSALGVLVWGALDGAPTLSVVLAAVAVVIAIVRTQLSFRLARSAAVPRRGPRTDELTGLPNRRAFNEAVSRALDGRPAQQTLALMIVDLDDFKGVNDSLGHHHGDDLLIQVAGRLQHGLRSADVLARIGGDEFAALVDGATADLASDVAERLRNGLRTPFRIAGHELTLTASVGIALFPGDGLEGGELFQRADIAMFNAKLTRTGQSLFTAEHYRTSRARMEAVDRLRSAIVTHEMVAYYQPLIRLGDDVAVGVEALVRWPQPDGTVVAPGQFLTQVESAGLMSLLTLEILDQSLAHIARWRTLGTVQTVAVNLSVTALLDSEFPGHVARLLEHHHVPGSVLELELTEDLLMADPTRAGKVVVALLALGVGIVVDDYGTGYSSLGYLRDLTGIRGLKLDRSFVTHLDVDQRARAIVASTITLARDLGLTVVAEGVETAQVRDVLVELGCEFAQGYHFARPMSAEAFDNTQSAADPSPVPGSTRARDTAPVEGRA
ncbi:MAG: EAL domain-containing protein [Nakamurella sp.]